MEATTTASFIAGPKQTLVANAADRAIQVEPGDQQQLARRTKKIATALTLYSDPELRSSLQLFTALDLKRAKREIRPRHVKRPSDFGRILGQYSRIDRLYLGFHGLEHGDVNIGHPKVHVIPVAGAAMTEALGSLPSLSVDTVEFLSCRVGFRVDLLAAFGKSIGADRVIAHTTWGLFRRIELPLAGRNVTERWLRTTLNRLGPFLDERNPSVETIMRRHKRGKRRRQVLLMRAGITGARPDISDVAGFKPPEVGQELSTDGFSLDEPFGRFIRPLTTEKRHVFRLADGMPKQIPFNDRLHCRVEIDLTP